MIDFDQIEQVFLQGGAQVSTRHTLVGNDAIVLTGAGEVKIIRWMTSGRRHTLIARGVQQGLIAQFSGERGHECETTRLFFLKHGEALTRALVDFIGLRSPEAGGHYHLGAEHDAIHHEVVTI